MSKKSDKVTFTFGDTCSDYPLEVIFSTETGIPITVKNPETGEERTVYIPKIEPCMYSCHNHPTQGK